MGRRRRPVVKVKRVSDQRYSVYVLYWIRGRKHELRGTTTGSSEKEVKARALEWVQKKQKEAARAYAALMLQRRKNTAESVCRALGI